MYILFMDILRFCFFFDDVNSLEFVGNFEMCVVWSFFNFLEFFF